jgi:hypothetical protein
MARVKTHYVNNKDLYAAMVTYKEKVEQAKIENKQPPVIPDYVGICFMKICNKLSTKPNFINYTYRDDMIADGIENCVASVDNFDPNKSTNPFAYFTQIAWNAFIRRIQKEKKQSYIKHKNYENNFMLEEIDGSILAKHKINEASSDIIKTFEDKLEATKTIKKNKVGVEKFVEEEKNV